MASDTRRAGRERAGGPGRLVGVKPSASPWHRVVALLLVGVALAATPAATAEEDPFEQPRLYRVRDTVAARNALAEGRAALARGETLVGLRALQSVLDEMPNDTARVPEHSSEASLLWRSAAEIARELLAGLGSEAAAAYEHMVQPAAEPAIAEALRRDDLLALEDVARRYGASSHGARATRLLAELSLEGGRPRDAARFAADGLRFAPRDPGLWRVRLLGLAAAGDRAALQRLDLPEDVLVSGPAGTQTLTALRDARLAALPPGRRGTAPHGWGGDMRRLGRAGPVAAQLPELRWSASVPSADRALDPRPWGGSRMEPTPDHFRWLLDAARPIMPVADGRTVYVADGRTVRALDLSSGRPLWRFDREADARLLRDDHMPPGRSSLDRAFAPVVAGDVVVATVEVPYRFHPEELSGMPLNTYLPRRRVVALDRTTGALRWMAGEDDVADPRLATASVVAPVAVGEGIVVALVDDYLQAHNLAVVGLDLVTGALRWHCHVGFGSQELNLFGNPLKELAGSAVALHEGDAYVATGLGLVVAVDIRAGSLRWIASYVPLPIEPVVTWYEAPLRRPRLGPGRAIVAGDTLLVAPGDAGHVLAYERATGRLRWQRRIDERLPRPTVAHLLGVVDQGGRDLAILTDGGVLALDVATGETAWVGHPVPDPSDIIGEGVLAGDDVLVPTGAGLQRFSLPREGSYRGTAPWPRKIEPGNLVVADDVLLLAGRETLSAFYDWDRIAAQIERQRRERPDDPELMLEAGDLYLRGGEMGRARAAFAAAEAIASKVGGPAVAAARRGIVATWLHEGRQHQEVGATEAARAAYEQAAALADDASDRIEARVRLVHLLPRDDLAWEVNLEQLVAQDGDLDAWVESGRPPVPIRAWGNLQLAEAALDRGDVARAIDLWQEVIARDPTADVFGLVAGRAAEQRIEERIALDGRSVYAPHEAEAQRRFAAATDEEAIDGILALYPNSLVREEALERRARLRREAGRWWEAAQDLRRLASTARDPQRRALALAWLTRVEIERGALGAARAARAVLRRELGDTAFTIDGSATTGAGWPFEVPVPAAPPAAAPPPLGRPLAEVHHERAADESQLQSIELLHDDAYAHAPFGLLHRGDSLVVLDLARGAAAFSVPLQAITRAASTPQRLVLVAERGEVLVGVDTATGGIAWTQPLDLSTRAMAIHGGIVCTAHRDLNRDEGLLSVRAFDAMTGSPLWTTLLGRADPSLLTAAADHVWLKRTRYEARTTIHDVTVLDVASGLLRHELPLPTYAPVDPWTDGRHLVTIGSPTRSSPPEVLAYDLHGGEVLWRVPWIGEPVTALASSPEGRLVALGGDGHVQEIDPAAGTVLHETGIYVGEGAAVRPFYGTALLVDATRLVLLPSLRARGTALLAYDRASGKLLWDHALTTEGFVGNAALGGVGDQVWAFVLQGARQSVTAALHILGPAGEVEQTVDLSGLAQSGRNPTVVQAAGAFLVVGRREASILR